MRAKPNVALRHSAFRINYVESAISAFLITNMTKISVNEVTKRYADHIALDRMCIEIPEHCIYGLLGPNGAGKTTLIRILNQITAPDSGEVLINGEKLNQKHITQIGYLPEERGLYIGVRHPPRMAIWFRSAVVFTSVRVSAVMSNRNRYPAS